MNAPTEMSHLVPEINQRDVPGALIGKKHDLGVIEMSSYGKPGAKG